MAIQDESELVTLFFDKQAFEAAKEHICALDRTDRPRLIALLETANQVYQDGLELIENNPGFRSFDEAAEKLVEIGRYTTSFPAMVLLALDKGQINDAKCIKLAEGLRSHSLYPRFVGEIIDPIIQDWAEQIGFSEPRRAQHLVYWRELQQNRIDLKTLEERLGLIRDGRLFIYQILGEQDRLDFVTETGYLLMRESGQRKVVAPDDPDCIAGQAAWPGICRGRARVVLSSNPESFEIEDGDILVSIQSNPNLMPLLRHAGAIVTDEGGVACHAGIICRELKIPTITATGRATSTIRDGDLVEVNATEQIVRILERADSSSGDNR